MRDRAGEIVERERRVMGMKESELRREVFTLQAQREGLLALIERYGFCHPDIQAARLDLEQIREIEGIRLMDLLTGVGERSRQRMKEAKGEGG